MVMSPPGSWTKLATWCRRAESCALTGAPLPAGGGAVGHAARTCAADGIPIATSLVNTAVQADALARCHQQRVGLRMTLNWRLGLCSVVALVVRTLHMQRLGLVSGREAVDATALIMAMLLVAATLWWFRSMLRPIWIGELELAAWLHAHIVGEVRAGGPAAAMLALLDEREMRTGASALSAKRAALAAWMARRIARDEQQLKRLGDLLPLAELGGGGVAAALVMVTPFLATLAD